VLIDERLKRKTIGVTLDSQVFTQRQSAQDFEKIVAKLDEHVCAYVANDSRIERSFAKELDIKSEVAVHAKLPRRFFVPTPMGD